MKNRQEIITKKVILKITNMDSDKKNYSSGTFQTITIWLLIPQNMAIATNIMFITVLETKLCWNDRNGTL